MGNELQNKLINARTKTNPLIEARKNSVAEFGSISHRLEHVDYVDGIEFINDSKSTDLGATEYSLEYLKKPVVWIVGESEMEEDYAELQKLVTYKVRGIVAFGKDTSRISRSLSNYVEYFIDVDSVEEAVKICHTCSKDGEAVLFSPACSSYNMFSNFKERGQVFCDAVARLREPDGTYDAQLFSRG